MDEQDGDLSPFQALVEDRMKELGLGRGDLAWRMGYSNVSKGMHRDGSPPRTSRPHVFGDLVDGCVREVAMGPPHRRQHGSFFGRERTFP
ncbi:MAG: hypothetical protein OXI79_06390 [Gammaproteobacteria bacterium]|nr:hypothetical protein [Gammaproteobacteria bacterium]